MSTLQITLAIVGGLVLAGVVAYNAWDTHRSAPRQPRGERLPDGSGESPFSASGRAPLDGLEDDSEGGRIEPVLGQAGSAGQAGLAGQGNPAGQGSPANTGRPQTAPAAMQPGVAPQRASSAAAAAGRAAAEGAATATPATATPAAIAAPVKAVQPAVSVTLSHVISPPEKRPGLDALIDVIAPLALDHPVSGDAVLAALPGTRRVGSKPFAVEGLPENGDDWESPRAGQRYRALQAGLQLANRAGALNDIEFSEFVVKAQAFADVLSATPDFPDMRAEVARARELDAFASGHDAQLGFTLRARRSAWSPGFVAQHAARQGFVAGALPGRWVLPGPVAGQPILSLAFDAQAAMAEDPEQSALREVSLSLEVTHVPRSEQPFVRMRQSAAALAESMDGVVTDDAGQPLLPETMDRIGADLESLYDALDSRDLSAGSPQARRLFS